MDGKVDSGRMDSMVDPLGLKSGGAVKHSVAGVTDGHMVIAQCLKALGVTHIYCLSGTPIRETFAYCAKIGIRPIGIHHQQAGIMMATAQNYVAGRVAAVALLSAGPAVTNAATSLLVARDNCWPVVVLGSRRPLLMQGMGSFQELDAVPVFRSITKWSALVDSTARIPEALEEAFMVAVSGRPGPVYLDFPEDVLTGLTRSYTTPSLKRLPSPSPDESVIERAADLLYHAARPGMIIGKGARWSEPFRELTRLVDDFGIPFITSPMGRGFLPDDHPLCCNRARSVLQAKADVILLVGARLDWTFRFGAEFAPDAKIIHIDIHEQEVGVNITPAVGIVGDSKEVLTRLLKHLALKYGGKETRSHWHAVLERANQSKLREWNGRMNDDSIPMSPYRMLKEVREFLPRDATCILDGNVFMAAAQQVLPAYIPVTRFTAGTNGCMGVGIPFGIGAKLAQPTRPVVVLCGDTAFAFSAMEMETAVRHQIPIIVVVVNNDGNSGALQQTALYPPGHERVTMFQPDIRYEQIMRAFGGGAEYVERPEQLRPALERAVRSGVAACINVKVDPHAPYPRD
jgi:thiamine pyrophosphate-dependent acetolactate synthase large subunit-like protein